MREEGCLTTAGRTLYPPLPSHSTGSSTLHGAKMQRLQQPLADLLNELPSAPGGPGPASGGRGSAAPRNAGGRQRQAWIGDSDEPATADAVRRMARAGRQALRTRPQSRPLSAEPTILSNRLRTSANLKRRGRPGPGGRNTGQRSTWIAPRWSTPGPARVAHAGGPLPELGQAYACCVLLWPLREESLSDGVRHIRLVVLGERGTPLTCLFDGRPQKLRCGLGGGGAYRVCAGRVMSPDVAGLVQELQREERLRLKDPVRARVGHCPDQRRGARLQGPVLFVGSFSGVTISVPRLARG